VQQDDPGSVLAAYREALALRKRHPALAIGSIRFLKPAGAVMSFVRESADGTILCVFNLSANAATWPRKAICGKLNLPHDNLEGYDATLPAWGHLIVPLR